VKISTCYFVESEVAIPTIARLDILRMPAEPRSPDQRRGASPFVLLVKRAKAETERIATIKLPYLWSTFAVVTRA
jgi:hypothetical protein